MISRLTTPYIYTAGEQACLATAANNWDSKSNCVKALKEKLHSHFDSNQNEKCCYCGLLYDRTGRGEIDHIAPKGAALHPQFSFTPTNLAKACQLCNSSSMKHFFDTIIALDPVYENCTFNIVHPYLDDHAFHFRWNYGLLNVVIAVNNNSDKARESIRIFELASEKRTRARAILRNQERLELLYNISNDVKNKIRAIITFK